MAACYDPRVLGLVTTFALIVSLHVGEELAQDKICTVHHTTEVRYRGLGYEHIVHISNACDEAVTCEVRTSSSHGHVDVTVPGRRRVGVITRRGTASRSFSATLACHAQSS